MSWPVLSESHPIQQQDGLTQTPQVAIDIRFSTRNDGALIFDIDYAQEAFSSQMIEDFLDALQLAIKQIIGSEIFSFDLSNFSVSFKINDHILKIMSPIIHLYHLKIMLNSKINYSTFT